MTSPSEQNLNRKTRALKSILKNYQQAEESIVKQLYMEHTLHGGTVGSMREDVWKGLFEMILPKKFVIEQSVFIIDSQEGISHEVDLAIVDETYTPYIFHYGRLKFIPIEAVAAVVECKSQSLSEDGLKTWCESIVSLKTADESIARTASGVATAAVPTQKSTRPIRVLCSLAPTISTEIQKMFDFVLTADDNPSRIDVWENETYGNLFSWYETLNFYGQAEALQALQQEEKRGELRVALRELEEISIQSYKIYGQDHKNISLLSFNFQFNQLLMLINNPMLFPHRAYVKMFQDHVQEGLTD